MRGSPEGHASHVLHDNTGTCRSTSVRVLHHRSSGDFLQHCFVDPNSGVEVFQGEILVRRVRATVRKSESKQQSFRTKNVTEIRHDWNAAALTNQHRITFESFLERALS